MARYFPDERRLAIKIAYQGAPGAGKTTNLEQVRFALDTLGPGEGEERARKDGIVSLVSPRLPVPMEEPFTLEIEVATRQGSAEDPEPWHRILGDADGIVFVVDSQRERLRDNLVAWADLLEHVRFLGRDIQQIPVVFQLNKLDLEHCMEPGALEAAINPEAYPSFEAAALHGRGVGKCFSEIIRRIVARAYGDLHLEEHSVRRAELTAAVDQALVELGARAAQVRKEVLAEDDQDAGERQEGPAEGTAAVEPGAPRTALAPPSFPAVEALAEDPLRSCYRTVVAARQETERLLESLREGVRAFHADSGKSWSYLQHLLAHLEGPQKTLPAALKKAVTGAREVLEFLRRRTDELAAAAARLAPTAGCDVRRVLEEAASDLGFHPAPDLVIDLDPSRPVSGEPAAVKLAFQVLLQDLLMHRPEQPRPLRILGGMVAGGYNVTVDAPGGVLCDGDPESAWRLPLLREILSQQGVRMRYRRRCRPVALVLRFALLASSLRSRPREPVAV